MKKLYVLCCITMIHFQVLTAQEISDQSTLTFDLSDIKTVYIVNHHGEVHVEGSTSSTGRMSVDRTLQSSSAERLEALKDSIIIDTLQVGQKLYFFVRDKDLNFKIDPEGEPYYDRRWGWYEENKKDRIEVRHRFDLTVQLPPHIDLYAKTHRENLRVENMKGKVTAKNHQGNVTLTGLTSDVTAHTHHGDIALDFESHPQEKVDAATHHGDIRIEVQKGLSADVSMQSHHGELFTDQSYEVIPAIAMVEAKDDPSLKFKIKSGTNIRVGSGKIKMHLNTYHGNVYLSE